MLLACPHCHATNRIDDARFDHDPVCGRCGRELTRGAPLALDEASFDVVVRVSTRPVVVDFWAAWCGPCRRFAPVFEAAALRHPGLIFAKVDTEAAAALSARLAIRSIPTLAVFHRGAQRERISGALSPAQFDHWLGQAARAAAASRA